MKFPIGPYNVIYADPPWSFKTWSTNGQDRAPDQHYATISLDDLKALDVNSISAKDAALFMWVYQPMIPEALELIKAWGFTYKTIAYVWIKTKGHQNHLFYGSDNVRKGLGYHTRAGSEQCWLATKGNGYRRISKSEPQIIFAPLREHSRKPDEISESICSLVGDVPKIELFARVRRDGWDCWGNEVERFSHFV